MSGRMTFPARAAAYAVLAPAMVAVARDHGYALAVRGSLCTDLDVVAVPWTDEAGCPHELMKALCAAVGGMLDPRITKKAHGRLAQMILLTVDVDKFHVMPWLDVSWMPRVGGAT
jgi:hypothetical protein